MLRENLKWRTHKRESTDAEHGGGLTRSSDEASEMEVERRGNMSEVTYWSTRNGRNLRVIQSP